MSKVCLSILVSMITAGAAAATDLNLSVQGAGGASSITVTPGATVPYSVVGVLSDATSGGLAMFSFDLALPGATLTQASAPTTSPMNRFAPPLGLSNPAGYGGTLQGGALIQIGGAQNTIKNTLAPVPNGSVITGVAQPTSPAVLVSSTFAAPYQVGSHTLALGSVFANVLKPGQTGVPFWKVDPANPGAIQSLSIQVSAIAANSSAISVTAQQSQVLTIDAGPANAGRSYVMLGSISGTSPGTVLTGGLLLPLNADGYLQFTRMSPNSAILSNSVGNLDAQGRATVTFTPNRRFIGLPVHHAFFLTNPADFVSEAEPCTVVE